MDCPLFDVNPSSEPTNASIFIEENTFANVVWKVAAIFVRP